MKAVVEETGYGDQSTCTELYYSGQLTAESCTVGYCNMHVSFELQRNSKTKVWSDTQVTRLLDMLDAKLRSSGRKDLCEPDSKPAPPAKELGPVELPDNTSCAEFNVTPRQFDLAYDEALLRKEFLDFIAEHSKTHRLSGDSGKYEGLLFDYDHNLFLHLGYVDERKFITGRENMLRKKVLELSRRQGGLKPVQVLEESLDLNDGNVFEALLTAHNFLRTDANLRRDELKYARQLKKAQEMLENATTKEDRVMREKQVADIKEKIKQKANVFSDEGTLKRLRGGDNVGAWYHLFGTLTGSFAYPATTGLAIMWEHRGEKSALDPAEYCWDTWVAGLGSEISGQIYLKKIEVPDMKFFEPSIIHDGYTL